VYRKEPEKYYGINSPLETEPMGAIKLNTSYMVNEKSKEILFCNKSFLCCGMRQVTREELKQFEKQFPEKSIYQYLRVTPYVAPYLETITSAH